MADSIRHHAERLRSGRCSEPLGLYLVTKCVDRPYELSINQRTDVMAALNYSRDKGDVRIHAFVVMPDHWHALFSLGIDKTLSKTMETIGRRASFRSRQTGEAVFWHGGFHDRKIRQDECVRDIVEYIEANPVRKGLAQKSADWPWSSACAECRDRLDRAFLGHERWA